jgi:hypothetical protein
VILKVEFLHFHFSSQRVLYNCRQFDEDYRALAEKKNENEEILLLKSP